MVGFWGEIVSLSEEVLEERAQALTARDAILMYQTLVPAIPYEDNKRKFFRSLLVACVKSEISRQEYEQIRLGVMSSSIDALNATLRYEDSIFTKYDLAGALRNLANVRGAALHVDGRVAPWAATLRL